MPDLGIDRDEQEMMMTEDKSNAGWRSALAVLPAVGTVLLPRVT